MPAHNWSRLHQGGHQCTICKQTAAPNTVVDADCPGPPKVAVDTRSAKARMQEQKALLAKLLAEMPVHIIAGHVAVMLKDRGADFVLPQLDVINQPLADLRWHLTDPVGDRP